MTDQIVEALAKTDFLAAGNTEDEWTPAVAKTWMQGRGFQNQAEALRKRQYGVHIIFVGSLMKPEEASWMTFDSEEDRERFLAYYRTPAGSYGVESLKTAQRWAVELYSEWETDDD